MTHRQRSSIALTVLLLAAAALAFMYVQTTNVAKSAPSVAKKEIRTSFSCTNGSTVNVVFADTSVRLTLSDGREFSIPRAVSADGARYANEDESFVFWNKGNSAFIEEGGTRTYSECTENTLQIL